MDPKRIELIKGLGTQIFQVLLDYAQEQEAAGRPSKEILSEVVAASLETGLASAAGIHMPPQMVIMSYISALEAHFVQAGETSAVDEVEDKGASVTDQVRKLKDMN